MTTTEAGDALFRLLPPSELCGRKAEVSHAVLTNAILPIAAKPGDIFIAHSKGILAWLIRVGTRSKWNHAGVIVKAGIDPLVVQAEARGVSEPVPFSTVAPGGYTAILPCPAGVDHWSVAEFALGQSGTPYGFLTIASIVLTIVTPVFIHFNFRRGDTFICSALVAFALLAGGWLHKWTDYYQVTPAQLALALVT